MAQSTTASRGVEKTPKAPKSPVTNGTGNEATIPKITVPDNQKIIIGCGLIIALVGLIIAIQEDRDIKPVIGGALGFTLLLGLLAATGDGPAKVASGLAALGAAGVIMYQAVPLFGLIEAIGGSSSKSSGGSPGIHGPWQGGPIGEMPHR